MATLKDIRVPDGYSGNIAHCVDLTDRTISGLKSHDCHVILQELLPLALKNTIPIDVAVVLVDLCNFFKHLCAKVLSSEELQQIQDKIILTLCHMEMIFYPSFFTSLVHVIVHLAEETQLAGPM